MKETSDPAGAKLRDADRYSAIAMALLGLYLLYESSYLRFGSVTRPGSGFLPTVLSVLLIGLALLLLVRSLRAPQDQTAAIFGPHVGPVAATLMAMVVYGGSLEFVGFPILTAVLLVFMLWGLGGVGPLKSTLLAVASTAAVFYIFRELGIPLPVGPIAP